MRFLNRVAVVLGVALGVALGAAEAEAKIIRLIPIHPDAIMAGNVVILADGVTEYPLPGMPAFYQMCVGGSCSAQVIDPDGVMVANPNMAGNPRDSSTYLFSCIERVDKGANSGEYILNWRPEYPRIGTGWKISIRARVGEGGSTYTVTDVTAAAIIFASNPDVAD